jgi:exopolysaccharide biosynthesis protein
MVKKIIKKIAFTIFIIFIICLIIFLGYLVNRYLIPRIELEVSSSNSNEEIVEENEITDTTYKSKDLKIEINKVETGEGKDKVTYYVADIKLENPNRIQRAFANNQFGTNIVEQMSALVERNNAILAINGDYYSFRKDGVIIGNSEIYRNVPAREGLAIYNDGTMEIYDETKVSAEELVENGVKTTLSFGPVLVRDGKIDADYSFFAVDGDNLIRANIADENPRTGIGYYEKNHYCFVVVDGRNEGYSKGVTLNEFAQIFEDLGCEFAYNLDGGSSTNMYFMGKKVNVSSVSGNIIERELSDILYIY